jgi:hypothetical protein
VEFEGQELVGRRLCEREFAIRGEELAEGLVSRVGAGTALPNGYRTGAFVALVNEEGPSAPLLP